MIDEIKECEKLLKKLKKIEIELEEQKQKFIYNKKIIHSKKTKQEVEEFIEDVSMGRK